MASLEDRLKQKLKIEEREKNEAKRREEERKKQERLREERVYPFVREAVDEFVILAKKYNTPKGETALYRKSLFGGDPKFKHIKVWDMPLGIYVDEKGNYYKSLPPVRYGPLDFYTEYGASEKITRDEAIDYICRSICSYSGQLNTSEEIQNYVQEMFVEELNKH